MSDLFEIYRSAAHLIERHGEFAPIEAANNAAMCLAQGDDPAASLWKKICFAAIELLKWTPAPGQPFH